MEYKCKLVVKNNLDYDDSFRIYIKYKPKNKIFYKQYDIINYSYFEWQTNNLLYGLNKNKSSIEELLKEFNNMSIEDIKESLRLHILNENKNSQSKQLEQKELDILIQTVKSKQQKFTIEI